MSNRIDGELDARTSLVYLVSGNVESVIGKHREVFVMGEQHLVGGRVPESPAGYASSLELKIIPHDATLPVRTLTFKGNSPVRVGDQIAAIVPAYHEGKRGVPAVNIYDSGQRSVYFPRDLVASERAIELRLYDGAGKLLRTDLAADYFPHGLSQ